MYVAVSVRNVSAFYVNKHWTDLQDPSAEPLFAEPVSHYAH